MNRLQYRRPSSPAMRVLPHPIATHYNKKRCPKGEAAPMDPFPFLAPAPSVTRSHPSPGQKAPGDRSHPRLPVAPDRAVSRLVYARAPRSRSAARQAPRSIAQKKNGAAFFPDQAPPLVCRKRPAPSAPLSNRGVPARLREENNSASTGDRLCPVNSSVRSAELASVPTKYRSVGE